MAILCYLNTQDLWGVKSVLSGLRQLALPLLWHTIIEMTCLFSDDGSITLVHVLVVLHSCEEGRNDVTSFVSLCHCSI